MKLKFYMLLWLALCSVCHVPAMDRKKINFNGGWLMRVGDGDHWYAPTASEAEYKPITLPHAFNEAEAFKVSIEHLSDTIVWYRKHFHLDEVSDRKFFLELEGVRFGADVWLNGHYVGLTENGVMASGFDLTPAVKKGENVLILRVDNSWGYRERATGIRFQWNDKNFNANYGGIPKNVYLHVTGTVYQTLPLYSSLQTTGTYIYGSDYDIPRRQVVVHAESEVKNESGQAQTLRLLTVLVDAQGKEVARFMGNPVQVTSGGKETLKAQGFLSGAHFWSWGYGYLYTVTTALVHEDGTVSDLVRTRTGFRKTRYADGKIWLNDRVLMVHGYAQRTSNEWPGVGMSVPAWLSDYSNHLMVESGGNLVRWMHVTPWKQDVESCDRVGLLEAMPAGDAEKDAQGRQWDQRKLLMRDAILYNRNNPSIIFYESGNKGISTEHMKEMKAIRDTYDPFGGRAIGCREMLDDTVAEYGGEMLYVNKSTTKPMWMMEYHRDEGLRKYWDDQSYPFHRDGDGPLYRGKPAAEYNHNMDSFAASMVERWYDYFVARPGTGRRVNAGGVKIVFSDTNTHHRGEANYRTSGVTDAMRIPKDAFYAHQVMWDGWVTPEFDRTYIVGHWNYSPGMVKHREYVVSTGDEVELFLNGKSLGKGTRSYEYLYTFKDIPWQPGTLIAVSRRAGKEISRDSLVTAGKPDHLKVTTIQDPEGFKADGADMALVQVEVVDREGRRCPLDNRMLHFSLQGEGEWLGGIATPQGRNGFKGLIHESDSTERQQRRKSGLLDASDAENVFDNYIRKKDLPVECGINRILVRSTPTAGTMTITVSTDGLDPASVTLSTNQVNQEHDLPSYTLPIRTDRGETPSSPSYTPVFETVKVISATAGSHQSEVSNSFDDNERSEWKSDGKEENAWVTYHLASKTEVDVISIKLTGWRNKRYPLSVYAGKKLVWSGWSYPTLGYCYLPIGKPVRAKELTIRMTGPEQTVGENSDTAELAGGKANALDRVKSSKGSVSLRIVEVDLLKKVKTSQNQGTLM